MYNYDDNEPIMLLIFFSYASKMSKIHVLNFPYTKVATYELLPFVKNMNFKMLYTVMQEMNL